MLPRIEYIGSFFIRTSGSWLRAIFCCWLCEACGKRCQAEVRQISC